MLLGDPIREPPKRTVHHLRPLGGVAGRADASIHDDRHGGLFADDAELIAGGEAFVRTDGCAERHDGGGAGFLKALCKHGIGVDVGQHGETFLHEDFGGFQRLNRIGQQVGGIGMDFELHPLRQACGGGEAGEAHGLLRVHRAAGVGQDEISFRIDEIEDVGLGVILS